MLEPRHDATDQQNFAQWLGGGAGGVGASNVPPTTGAPELIAPAFKPGTKRPKQAGA